MKYIKLFENFNNTLINESYTFQNFVTDFSTDDFFKPFIQAIVKNGDYDINIEDDWNKIMNMNRQEIKNIFGYDLTIGKSLQIANKVKAVKTKSEETKKDTNTIEGRLEALKEFFKGSSTGLESERIRGIYKHFKNGKSIDDLEPILKNLYKNSPGIFNFSNFTKEQFIEIIDKVGEDNSSFRELLDKRDDTPSFDISSIGTAYLR